MALFSLLIDEVAPPNSNATAKPQTQPSLLGEDLCGAVTSGLEKDSSFFSNDGQQLDRQADDKRVVLAPDCQHYTRAKVGLRPLTDSLSTAGGDIKLH